MILRARDHRRLLACLSLLVALAVLASFKGQATAGAVTERTPQHAAALRRAKASRHANPKPSPHGKPKARPKKRAKALVCHPRPVQETQGSIRITVSPGTCLRGREVVTVTGSGFHPNSPGGIAECNSASAQPTVPVQGSAVPVSCTNPLAAPATSASSGTLETTFSVVTGITGPPARGTDSAGAAATKDAPRYPCPPTAAQRAAGATCTIAFGDAAGDQVSVAISFVPGVKRSSTKPGSTLSPSIPFG